ncbi:interleukin-2 receptor subunit alpha [Dryobates pubescens]|uniref:interleukin-2 receptor subunit alpha n=1 Tax=Dryobates pubescens TaxID=118200 RepID=UPI0023B8F385|nr:interleukin-2 receptor subunit alpha [Dryobates pubescens]
MELKCLLMWLLFGSVKEDKTEKCPALPTIEFADSTAETYQLGTRLYYECDRGYKRRSGQHSVIRCQSAKHGASWDYKEFECIANLTFPTDEKTLLSTAPTTKSVFTQKPERKTPQKQENFLGFEQKDLCGPPRTIPHASLSVNRKYYVGQVLHFKCQSGYDKQPPTSGTRMCKKKNGKIIWTHLDMRCTNNTNEWPPQTNKLVSTHPSFSSSVMLPVTAISFILFIIPAVFM